MVVMILGYAIIAVPSGIVTAEIFEAGAGVTQSNDALLPALHGRRPRRGCALLQVVRGGSRVGRRASLTRAARINRLEGCQRPLAGPRPLPGYCFALPRFAFCLRRPEGSEFASRGFHPPSICRLAYQLPSSIRR